jgi:hypothetical protein
MKRSVILAACAAASVALSGCASLSNLTQAGGVGEKVLQNLEGCHREYSGALGAGVTGSFRIVCAPTQPLPAAQVAPTAPANPPGGT